MRLQQCTNKQLNSEGDKPEPRHSKKSPILFDQAELNDLIRDLNLSKDKTILLGFRLKKKNLLNENVRISNRNREKDQANFFSDEDGLICCNYVNKLMKAVGHKHIASEWRLFIDSNKTSLLRVLLLLLKINYHAHC